jgi:hypothetical protein
MKKAIIAFVMAAAQLILEIIEHRRKKK